MQAYKTHQNIPQDRHVTLTLPPDFPVGEAEIIVLARTEPGERARQGESLKEFFRKLDESDLPHRSKEEIDRYLEEERASWER